MFLRVTRTVLGGAATYIPGHDAPAAGTAWVEKSARFRQSSHAKLRLERKDNNLVSLSPIRVRLNKINRLLHGIILDG